MPHRVTMNQINLGEKAGIDTKQVQYWEMRDGEEPTFAGTEEGPQTRVQFKNGKEEILRGDAKAAFDAWASLIEQRAIQEVPGPSVDQLAAMAYKQGVRAGREEATARLDCKLCVDYNLATDHCTRLYIVDQPKGFPECWRAREEEAPPSDPKPLCKTCRKHNEKHGWCMDSSMVYPECYKQYAKQPKYSTRCQCGTCFWWRMEHDEALVGLCMNQGEICSGDERAETSWCSEWEAWGRELNTEDGEPQYRRCATCRSFNGESNVCHNTDEAECYPGCYKREGAPNPLCPTCACYDAESGHCTEFAGNHYPECWVAKEEEAEIECASCCHYSGPPSYYCVPGRGWERPGCYEKGNRKALRAARKAAEAAGAGSSDAADKVELPPRGTLCQSCQFYSPDTRRCTKREREEFPECHVDNVWVCSGCGLALGTDMKGQIVRVSSGGCELYIQGEVRIQSNDVPLVVCLKCRTANLWPDELRERVARSYEKSLQFPKLRWSPKHNHMMVQESVQGEERATVHTHMHSSCGSGGTPHEHPHVIGDHHGGEEASYPNEKRYVRSDTQ